MYNICLWRSGWSSNATRLDRNNIRVIFSSLCSSYCDSMELSSTWSCVLFIARIINHGLNIQHSTFCACYWIVLCCPVDIGRCTIVVYICVNNCGNVSDVLYSTRLGLVRWLWWAAGCWLWRLVERDWDRMSIPVAALRSVAPGANVPPAAPPCPRFQPTRECGELPSVRMGWPRPKMKLMHFKCYRTPPVGGYREL